MRTIGNLHDEIMAMHEDGYWKDLVEKQASFADASAALKEAVTKDVMAEANTELAKIMAQTSLQMVNFDIIVEHLQAKHGHKWNLTDESIIKALTCEQCGEPLKVMTIAQVENTYSINGGLHFHEGDKRYTTEQGEVWLTCGACSNEWAHMPGWVRRYVNKKLGKTPPESPF